MKSILESFLGSVGRLAGGAVTRGVRDVAWPIAKNVGLPAASLPGRLTYGIGRTVLNTGIGKAAAVGTVAAALARANVLDKEKKKEQQENTPEKSNTEELKAQRLKFERLGRLNEIENLPSLPIIPNPATTPIRIKNTLFNSARNKIKKPFDTEKMINDRTTQAQKLIPKRKPEMGTPKGLGKLMG